MSSAVMNQWKELKDSAREQFYWEQPGVNFRGLNAEQYSALDDFNNQDSNTAATTEKKSDDDNNISKIPIGGRDHESGKVLDPPDTFLLLLVYPESVKYLRLQDNFAANDLRDPSIGNWKTERVNP